MGLDEIYIWCEIQVGDSTGYYDPDHHKIQHCDLNSISYCTAGINASHSVLELHNFAEYFIVQFHVADTLHALLSSFLFLQ
jgi:hypothetical protein